MINGLYPLLQLCDSNFPSGTFSHSFGFETYIQEGKISDPLTLLSALKRYCCKQLTYVEGLACRLAYESLDAGCFSEVFKWDHYLYASNLAEETRLGNRRIGERLAKLCLELYPSNELEEYVEAIKKKEAYGHSSIVFALVCHDLNISIRETLQAYLYSSVSSLVQNAVRGIPLGQTDGQKILVNMQEEINHALKLINRASREEFGAVSPGLEMAQMNHERLTVRLFMS
ncbi:urease accessory protein UreF [Pullulanibacillus sp. KACC 23026]|uniref:urease accessory protein UreF n=1 Tax=Pullulanibacillus sp. KACC 23026 TaxID=3028315 RepID=UPI0023AF66A9|nr:urease accessory protein UreF [Pullulanibacillus sp. KACC 23026]WEG14782.1 urease accessory protein UreF [Pullulanibacillus sp. KACC 23026]